VAGVRGRLSRLRREASQGAVLIRQRDGTIRAFDKMHVIQDARHGAGLPRSTRRRSWPASAAL
jgi:hypothetical protein